MSFDLCFIQQHWLHSAQLNKISLDFLSVSVSGMDSCVLLQGCPFGGCSILYRKSFCLWLLLLVLVQIVLQCEIGR